MWSVEKVHPARHEKRCVAAASNRAKTACFRGENGLEKSFASELG
jgi:hypothetical protein